MYLLQKLKGDFTTGKEYCVCVCSCTWRCMHIHACTCRSQVTTSGVALQMLSITFFLCCEGDIRWALRICLPHSACGTVPPKRVSNVHLNNSAVGEWRVKTMVALSLLSAMASVLKKTNKKETKHWTTIELCIVNLPFSSSLEKPRLVKCPVKSPGITTVELTRFSLEFLSWNRRMPSWYTVSS